MDFVERAVRPPDLVPRLLRALAWGGIRSGRGGLGLASGAWPGGSAGALATTGGRLGSWCLFEELGAGRCEAGRDWLWRRGRGTGRFLLFGSPQRCTTGDGAQSN